MSNIQIKQLSRTRYNAYVGYTRDPRVASYTDEIEFYSDGSESIIGLILFDHPDEEFNSLLLGKDTDQKFRCFDIKINFPTKKAAVDYVKTEIRRLTRDNMNLFPQGDEEGSLDFFAPVVPANKLNPFFRLLSTDISFSPAKGIIEIMMRHYLDVDGNFIEQFQTTGFDARIWELYLFNYLTEAGFLLRRDYHAPDFMVTNGVEHFAIEAVIVGRKADNPPTGAPKDLSEAEIAEKIFELENEMPIRFGSPLYSKLKKEYWNLPHVADNPLIFAIADFHDDLSMTWSSSALTTYLYGIKHTHSYDAQGKLIVATTPVLEHVSGNKRIPSGFFFQPDANRVSAILFSANGSISKFNRMGRYAGFGAKNIIMHREGACHNHNPNASKPDFFRFELKPAKGDSTPELWAEGLAMFHNPTALKPIHPLAFPSIAHHFFENGQIISIFPDFYPYFSRTTSLVIK